MYDGGALAARGSSELVPVHEPVAEFRSVLRLRRLVIATARTCNITKAQPTMETQHNPITITPTSMLCRSASPEKLEKQPFTALLFNTTCIIIIIIIIIIHVIAIITIVIVIIVILIVLLLLLLLLFYYCNQLTRAKSAITEFG